MIAGLWSFDGSCHGATTIQATLIQYSKCVFIFIHNYNFDSSQKPQKERPGRFWCMQALIQIRTAAVLYLYQHGK